MCVTMVFLFFFFKQKTAYEMRISDWSSDVCSSDLPVSSSSSVEPGAACDSIIVRIERVRLVAAVPFQKSCSANANAGTSMLGLEPRTSLTVRTPAGSTRPMRPERKSVELGKRGSVRVDLGGRRVIKNKTSKTHKYDTFQTNIYDI